MNWSTRRKLLYTFGIIASVITLFLYFFRATIFPTPTCFDNNQNGYESGVDCGGTCSLRCSEEIIPLSVMWSRALQTGTSTYDFVTMVSNKNINNTSKALGYTFTAYDENGNQIKIVEGTTTAPVNSDFPIIKQNINLSQKPKEIVVKLFDTSHFTVDEKPTSPTVRTMNIKYEAGNIPRVYATVVNTKRITISNLPVRVVVYDGNNNAFAAGETIINFLDKEGLQNIAFTWSQSFTQTPSKIRIYPIFDAFLSAQ
ncbi:MAG: hypothetical protein WCT07_03160 [Candidatus Paceibacterota bacterium]|jgi:hypothetical protein